VDTKKGMTRDFFYPSLLLLFLDPESGMDKKSGSATLSESGGLQELLTRSSNNDDKQE
jgi:hypothetical protein